LISQQRIQKEDEDTVIASIVVDHEINQIFSEAVHQLPISSKLIAEETARDPVLQEVIGYLRTGWPSEVIGESKQLFLRKEALTMVRECIMLGNRVVIPKVLRDRVLAQMHEGHPGISRMKALARSYAYWPSIDAHIEDLVRSCNQCASVAKSPIKSELFSWPKPEKPWERVHLDFAGPLNGYYFLIAVDSFSKWPEVFMMTRTSTTETITALSKLFAQFGVPELIVTDNGPQFTSYEFSNFCASQGIQHLRSPAYHPQSNGQAERFVDTLKRGLMQIGSGKTIQQNIDIFLRSYRSTPGNSVPNQLSPAEVFLGRRIRLPLDRMLPSTGFLDRDCRMEQQFNRRHGAIARCFSPGACVYVKNFRGGQVKWIPAKVIHRIGNVLYKVQVGSYIWTRHVNHIRKRYDDSVKDNTPPSILPYDILIEDHPAEETSVPNTTPPSPPISVSPNVRHSLRSRPPIKRLVLNPSFKSYSEY
jgi:transposase InsO family protein